MKRIWDRFLAPEGRYPAGGLFSPGHFILLGCTIILIRRALFATLTWKYHRLRRLIRILSLVLLTLEVLKICFKRIREHPVSGYDSWIPLYYCSITMYASVLSGFGSGVMQHTGDVFLSTGALIGGVCFLLYPSSSIMIYPWQHFLCLHSFFYHGCLTYLGILVNRSGLLVLKRGDWLYYVLFFSIFCFLADRANRRNGTNLMFLSHPLRGTFLDRLHRIQGGAYTFAMFLVQAVAPYAVVRLFQTYSTLLTRPAWYP